MLVSRGKQSCLNHQSLSIIVSTTLFSIDEGLLRLLKQAKSAH